MYKTVQNFTNPIFASALQNNHSDVCYCYRTLHSVSTFYILAGIILAISTVILTIFFVFGDGFFHEKYKREYASGSGSKESGDKTLNTIE